MLELLELSEYSPLELDELSEMFSNELELELELENISLELLEKLLEL